MSLHTLRDLIYRWGLLALLAAFIVYFWITQPAFGTWTNVIVILESVAVVAIVSLGVTVSMTVDGFDMSVGSNVSFVSMLVSASLVYWGLGTVWSILIGLVAGALIGLLNGILIVVARIPDMLATLGMMFVFAGLSLEFSAGQTIAPGSGYQGGVPKGDFTSAFKWLGQGQIGPIPVSVVAMIVIAVLVIVFLARTRTGRLLRAIGGNRTAARLAGVRVGPHRVLAYVLSGTLAAIGAELLTSRLGQGLVNVGSDYLLQTVSASLIGFAVLGANRPNAFGTLVGALFVAVLLNGLTMLNVSYYTQDFVQGILLVGALVVSFSALFNRKLRA